MNHAHSLLVGPLLAAYRQLQLFVAFAQLHCGAEGLLATIPDITPPVVPSTPAGLHQHQRRNRRRGDKTSRDGFGCRLGGNPPSFADRVGSMDAAGVLKEVESESQRARAEVFRRWQALLGCLSDLKLGIRKQLRHSWQEDAWLQCHKFVVKRRSHSTEVAQVRCCRSCI